MEQFPSQQYHSQFQYEYEYDDDDDDDDGDGDDDVMMMTMTMTMVTMTMTMMTMMMMTMMMMIVDAKSGLPPWEGTLFLDKDQTCLEGFQTGVPVRGVRLIYNNQPSLGPW